jgi:serine/threonine-protein kinase
MNRLKQFITEIHRRSLWQVLLIYVGAALVAYQAVQALTEGLGLPQWFPAFAIVLFIIGLPIVLATAFVHEVAPPLAAAHLEARRRHRFLTWRNAAASFVVALAAWGVVATGWLVLHERGEASVERKSVAVLPFENMSADPDNEYFSDGITDDIITHLSKIADLKVISRTSVMQYKGTEKTVRQIGEELGVATVLEGGVQRAGDRVRINAQLIDAETDEHLWAEQYNRQLTDVFEIQTHVAQQIALALRARLTEEETERIEARATDNLEAYDVYLRGLTYARRAASLRRIEDARLAVEMFERAVELDPNYVEGHAALSRSYGELFSDFGQVEAGPKAKEAADRAMQLAPDRPASRMALGWYDWLVTGEFEAAEEHFAMARRGLPSNADLLAALGGVQLRQGKWEHAIATLKEAVRLDPQSPDPLVALGRTYYVMRRYSDAEDYLTRSVALFPDDHWAHFWKTMLYLTWDGGTERAQGALQGASQRADLLRFLLVSWDFDDRMVLRIFADHFAAGLNRRTLADPADSAAYYLAKADAAARNDRAVVAYAYYDSARFVLEPRLWAPDPSRHHSRLGIAYAGLSQAEEAIREGKEAFELAVASKHGLLSGSYSGPDLAEIYLMVGEYDAAIDQLERLLSMPSIISVPLLRFDPIWNPLRDHPRFQALLEKYEQ